MGSISTVYGNRDAITKDGYLGIGDGVVRIGLCVEFVYVRVGNDAMLLSWNAAYRHVPMLH